MGSRRIIRGKRDIRYYLEKGYSHLQISTLHWKQNVEMMEKDKFGDIEIYDGACALCYEYSDCGCVGCPLGEGDHFCGDRKSLWENVRTRMAELKSHISGRDGKLLSKIKEYELKASVLLASKDLLFFLERLVEEENKKVRDFGKEKILLVETRDGDDPINLRLIELNDSGIYIEDGRFDFDGVKNIKVYEDGEFKLIWGDNFRGDRDDLPYITKSVKVGSWSEPDETYVITWKEINDVDSELHGKRYGGSCTCPSFKFGVARPCKHMESCGLGDTVDEDNMVDNRKNHF